MNEDIDALVDWQLQQQPPEVQVCRVCLREAGDQAREFLESIRLIEDAFPVGEEQKP